MNTDGAQELRRNSVSDKCCSLFLRYSTSTCIEKTHLLTYSVTLHLQSQTFFRARFVQLLGVYLCTKA